MGSRCATIAALSAWTAPPSPTSSINECDRLLDELAVDLKGGTYRPLPV
jgi:hypothetical protein